MDRSELAQVLAFRRMYVLSMAIALLGTTSLRRLGMLPECMIAAALATSLANGFPPAVSAGEVAATRWVTGPSWNTRLSRWGSATGARDIGEHFSGGIDLNRRDIVRYVVRQHVLGWLLALAVLGVVYFFGMGRAPDAPVLLVAAFALLVVTPVLYFVARRVIGERE